MFPEQSSGASTILFTFCCCAAILLVITKLLSTCFYPHFPSLPGPTLRQYLPYGEVWPMFRDLRNTLRTIDTIGKRYGDVFELWLGPTRTVATCLPADIVHILTATDTFVKPRAMTASFEKVAPGGLLLMPRNVHTRARRQLRDNFNYTMLPRYHAHVALAVDELIQTLKPIAAAASREHFSPPLGIAPLFGITMVSIISGVAFGASLPVQARLDFARNSEVLADELLRDILGYPFIQILSQLGLQRGLMDARRRAHAFCRALVEQRLAESPSQRQSRPTDALDAAMAVGDDDMLAVTSQAVELAIAGSHSTNQSMTWALFAIHRDPDVKRKVVAEVREQFAGRALEQAVTFEDVGKLRYLQMVWKETLRLFPTGGGHLRTATRDVRLKGSGTEICKGTHVFGLICRAHRDERYWKDAERFVPERWAGEEGKREANRAPAGAWVPFSLGARDCAGRFLADYVSIVILAEMHRHFDMKLGCEVEEVVSCSSFVETPKYASRRGGEIDSGLPMQFRQWGCR